MGIVRFPIGQWKWSLKYYWILVLTMDVSVQSAGVYFVNCNPLIATVGQKFFLHPTITNSGTNLRSILGCDFQFHPSHNLTVRILLIDLISLLISCTFGKNLTNVSSLWHRDVGCHFLTISLRLKFDRSVSGCFDAHSLWKRVFLSKCWLNEVYILTLWKVQATCITSMSFSGLSISTPPESAI